MIEVVFAYHSRDWLGRSRSQLRNQERKYGLDRIMTKLVETSRAVITMAFFVMNAEKILRLLRLLLSILVSVYILMLCLWAPWRRPALVWAT